LSNWRTDEHYISGPGCSETAEPIAGVSKHFNTIVISYSAEALQLTNRAMFPLFFRTIPHILQNGYETLFEVPYCGGAPETTD
jgi:Receptor family ligand binding region